MKRFLAIASLGLAASLAMGCALIWTRGNGNLITEQRVSGSSFSSVSAEGTFDVIVTEAASCSVSIEAEENLLPYITTEIEGTTLRLGIAPFMNLWPTTTFVVRVCAPSFAAVANTGTGNLTAGPFASSAYLTLAVTGTGNAALSGDFNALALTMTGTGGATLSGTTDSLNVTMTGTGSLEAYAMPTPQANITVDGTGGARVTINGSLSCHLDGIGNIEYKGTVTNPTVSGSGLGRLICRN